MVSGFCINALVALVAAMGAAGVAAETPKAAAIVIPDAAQTQAFVRELRAEAIDSGIAARVFDEAFIGFTPIAEVLRALVRQPEFTRPPWDYIRRAVSEKRVNDGQAAWVQHQVLLRRLEQTHGVPASVLAAIWGLETHYGTRMGRYRLTDALGTLAMSQRRARYGRTQSLAALRLIQRGSIKPEAMIGSWAGAMGHTQFIPTTYEVYAQDGDGDGSADPWNPYDALASAAHYLAESGWRRDLDWGVEVRPPPEFDYTLAEGKATFDLWAARGFVRLRRGEARGEALRGATLGRMVQPAGHGGPTFLVTRNFDALLRYNNATSYALAVGFLARALAGGLGAPRTPWPEDEPRLARTEIKEMQTLLTKHGHDPGGVDGLAGAQTRRALRAFQSSQGVVADGYPDSEALGTLRRR